ncbi:MAG: AAA family ATPase, partial [Planctomycetes bacterium]|nr:AAA family ATPase [Planctomycetota bacterium]
MSFFTPTHWQKVLSFLRSRTAYTTKEYKYWFSRLEPNFENNSSMIHINCPNQFIAFELQNKFCKIFEKIIYKITEKQYKVKFINGLNKVNTDMHILEVKDAHLFTKKAPTKELNQLKPTIKLGNKPMKPSGLRQIVIPSVYSPDFEMPCSHIAQRYSFDNFVVGKSNQLAHTAAITVSESPGTMYNPLFIYGDHGLGKSHLLHAIANQIRGVDPYAKTMIMSAASFTSSYLNAVEANKLLEFTTHIKNADALLIDDIGHFTTHSYAVSELQKIINHFVTNQKLMVFTGNLNPAELKEFSEEFSAGVLRGLSAVINQPEYQTRFEIIKLKANQMEFNFNDEIIEFLAQNFALAPRKLEGIVKKLGVHEQVGGILSIYDVRFLFQ